MRASCAWCGSSFEQKHIAHVLCSGSCAHARWVARGRRPADPELTLCRGCGSPFVRANPKRWYCSHACKNRVTASRHRTNVRDRTRQRDWARAHRKENTQRSIAWAARHPERRRSIAVARRARERGAAGRWTASDWTDLLVRYGHRCAYCGATGSLTVDHRVPLARGGSNEVDNILPACGWCNRSKGTLSEGEFRNRLARSLVVGVVLWRAAKMIRLAA
jgi:5-methylcytosine-specific restriction endonuclease McrA